MSSPANSEETPITVNFRGEPLTFRYAGHLTPAGNRRLTDAEYRTASSLADLVAGLRSPAAGAAASALAPDIAAGDNAWAGDLAGGWHPLYRKDRRHFEHLRLLCQPFTGFDPISNTLDGRAPATIPDDVDERLQHHTNVSIAMMELLAAQRRLPDYARVQLPGFLGEAGPVCDGVIASYDAWSLQTQMNGLYGSGLLGRLRQESAEGRPVTVVDIGSGFGGLGYQLGQALAPGRQRFVAVDLPDSLLFAAIYLSLLWAGQPTYVATPDGYVSTETWRTIQRLPDSFAGVFVVTHLAERVLGELRPVDLVLNFRSMQEMSDAQVRQYGELARAVIGDRGLLYEQNELRRAVDRDVKTILGGILPVGGVIEETDPPHRAMGTASLWSNRPIALTRPAPPAA